MRFQLLGPMRIQPAGTPLRIAAPKQRTLLAMLLAHEGRPVPVSSLVAEVWDERPPSSAVANLRTYLMRLRHLLSPDGHPDGERLVTSDGGYLLRVEPAEFDLAQFEASSVRARRSRERGELEAAHDEYAAALALWRGTPVEDVPLGPSLREVVAHLTERYLSTVEEFTEVQFALGRHAAAAERLRALTVRHPLREGLRGRLMVALYRCGDVAGALDAFRTARQALADELHVEPGPELRRLHQAILRREPDVEPPGVHIPDRRPRPRQLPREPAVFTGRSTELSLAAQALLRDDPPAAPPPHATGPATPPPWAAGGGSRLLALHGPAGAGKSALALRAAHLAAGHYPDGRLYSDMQGCAPELAPLRPTEVLGRFLRALGVPHGDVPATQAEAAAVYQSMLADRRVLVFLDNAADAAQVAPLLPAGDGCAAVVTSRPMLSTLDAVHVSVGMLGQAESVRMLALLAGEARVAAEPAAAADIALLCGHQPLALRIAAARLAGRPDWSLARFAERLRDRGRRLDELQTAGLSVRSSFEASLAALKECPGKDVAMRAFRLFGAADLPEIGLAHAAELLGVAAEEAEAALDELMKAHLLELIGADRFRMHELLRIFAGELATPLKHATPL
ncbi:BTAD domain-containing putative transcriptional regulator [Nonomuraea sp. GTA35]|uniref:AfsR/SARP family transcriptional regulator n=1 Tax=Nonomuraea sp. GTA35 TaxID=1676746 RepID=UPI0035C122C0